MATLRTVLSVRGTFGGEERRVEFPSPRDLTIAGDVVCDVSATIVENTLGAPVILWQGAGHGVAVPTSEFERGVFLVDADDGAASSLPLALELSWTDQAGAVSSRVVQVSRENVELLEPLGGATFAALTDRLTRIRTANPAGVGSPAGSNNVRCRLLLVK